MKRRELLRMIGGAFALSGTALPSLVAHATAGLRAAARNTLRAPSDLLSRVRKRTRPLEEHHLDEEHDLAG
jgi:hypothetical protein